jgi:hypothetical protein
VLYSYLNVLSARLMAKDIRVREMGADRERVVAVVLPEKAKRVGPARIFLLRRHIRVRDHGTIDDRRISPHLGQG